MELPVAIAVGLLMVSEVPEAIVAEEFTLMVILVPAVMAVTVAPAGIFVPVMA